MIISVFGLGYVGCVSAACLAADGHRVIGVDVNAAKVAMLGEGSSPIVEPGLAELVAQTVASGRLRATLDAAQALQESEVVLVCIQTPSADNGSLDLRYIVQVAEQIGTGLRERTGRCTVAFRSTMLPGTMEQVVLPMLERASGQPAGPQYGVGYLPEFLREGSAIDDHRHPSRTVIGASDARTADTLRSLFRHLAAPEVVCELRTAELVKYADNAFHALKVAFANEIGALCRGAGIDSHRLMQTFCLDTKLNVSPAYLRPGAAFGGSCLPKDLRALSHWARGMDLQVPVLEAVLASNEVHQRRALSLVMRQGHRQVGVLGLSFKDGTDDLRESPAVTLVEQLVGKGYDVRIYDPSVAITRLMGRNKAYIERELPHIASLLVDDVDALLDASQTIVIAKRSSDFGHAVKRLRPDHTVVDLGRYYPEIAADGDRYHALIG